MHPILLSSLVGNGVQLIVALIILLVTGWLGYFTPDLVRAYTIHTHNT